MLIVDGETIFVHDNFESVNKFLKAIYRKHEIKYSKYFKMDNLSKLGFITSEALLKDTNINDKYKGDEIGLIIANSHSSLDTDKKYFETIRDKDNYFPSPSKFVYTLANILVGEICIRNKFLGESTFFISEKFDPQFISWYINDLMASKRIKCCIGGWVDLDESNYESFLFLAEKSDNGGNLQCNKNNLENIYFI